MRNYDINKDAHETVIPISRRIPGLLPKGLITTGLRHAVWLLKGVVILQLMSLNNVVTRSDDLKYECFSVDAW